jgi:hypothetical protein
MELTSLRKVEDKSRTKSLNSNTNCFNLRCARGNARGLFRITNKAEADQRKKRAAAAEEPPHLEILQT